MLFMSPIIGLVCLCLYIGDYMVRKEQAAIANFEVGIGSVYILVGLIAGWLLYKSLKKLGLFDYQKNL